MNNCRVFLFYMTFSEELLMIRYNQHNILFGFMIRTRLGSFVKESSSPGLLLFCLRDWLQDLLKSLNPENIPGRITLIHRFGADKIEDTLPHLIKTVQESASPVLWVCDPMHGNTESTSSGVKTRRFDNITSELESAFKIHKNIKVIQLYKFFTIIATFSSKFSIPSPGFNNRAICLLISDLSSSISSCSLNSSIRLDTMLFEG